MRDSKGREYVVVEAKDVVPGTMLIGCDTFDWNCPHRVLAVAPGAFVIDGVVGHDRYTWSYPKGKELRAVPPTEILDPAWGEVCP